MLAIVIPFVYPFVFLVSTSLKTSGDYQAHQLGLPRHVTFDNISFAWQSASLGQAMLNSAFAVCLSVVILVPVSAAGGFWAVRHQGRMARLSLALLFSLWAVPFIVYAVPFYVMAARLHALNSLTVLGVLYAAVNIPFGVYLMQAYYQQGLPPELLEAAALDGATTWRTFRHIVVPLGRPALGTLAALGFVWCWGDLVMAAFLMQQASSYTVPVAAATLASRFDARIQPTSAAALISLLPLLLVFLFAQRAISRGLTAGAVK
jgi:multiple sugar transport system permease protein